MSVWLEPGLPRFLINAGLAGTVISLIGWIASLMLARARTEWRLAAIQATFIALIATPIIVLLGQQVGAGQIQDPATYATHSGRAIGQVEQTISLQTNARSQPPKITDPLPTSKEPTAGFVVSPVWVGLLWAALASALLIRTGWRQLLLKRWLRAHAAQIEEEPPFPVYEADVSAPFCGGVLKPFIVVPKDFGDLPNQERRSVMLHEASHLAFRHPFQQLVGEVACALFAWLPLTALLSRQQDDLQEQQCDEEVVRTEGDGLALAKGLVRFAARCGASPQPASTLSIVRRPSRLERRVQRLTQKGGFTPPKKLYVTVAAFACGTLATALALAIQIKPDPLSEIKAFLPFKPGTVWTYRLTLPDGKTQQVELRPISIQPHKPYPVMEFQRTWRKSINFQYWTATQEGLRPLLGSRLGRPGFTDSPVYGIRFPATLEAGYEWRWSEPWIGQTMVGLGRTRPSPPPPVQYKGKVLAVDQSVRVPYGTVKATVIEITASATYPTTRTYWARDIGIVKTEYLDDKGKVTQFEELVSVASKIAKT